MTRKNPDRLSLDESIALARRVQNWRFSDQAFNYIGSISETIVEVGLRELVWLDIYSGPINVGPVYSDMEGKNEQRRLIDLYHYVEKKYSNSCRLELSEQIRQRVSGLKQLLACPETQGGVSK